MSNFIARYGGDMNTRSSGLASLNRALSSGLTLNQIRDQTAREGVNFGTRARQFLDARPSNLFISQYGGDAQGMRNSGLASIRRATEAGMTLNEIRNRASSEGIGWGSGAQAYFAARPESAFISQYGGNEETFMNSGINSVNRALAAGLSPEDIENRGRAENITWGEKAAAFLNSDKLNRDRIGSLTSQLDQQTKANEDLVKKFDGIEAGYKSDLAGLNSTISDLQKSYSDQQASYIEQLRKANNSYNPRTSVGTSAGLGGFSPNSQGTPMSIKQQGTGRFNRDNRRRNTLNITNLNV